MPVTATAPGVSVELVDRSAAGLPALRTDIAGFTGVAQRGPLGAPVAVESWRQFQSVFGGLHPDARLADAVKGFFDNGGRRAHIVRAAAPASETWPAAPDTTGATSPIVAAAGFVPGAVATVALALAPVSVGVTIAAVDPASGLLTWAQPLSPGAADIWPDRPVHVLAADGTRTVSAPGVRQPRDLAALFVRSTAALRPGQPVELLQTEREQSAAHRILDVLDGGTRLVWETPLEPRLAAQPDLTLTTGATTASAVFRNALGEPLFSVAASSPGTWGNDLRVLARASNGASTASAGPEQPDDRSATRVTDVSGFDRGDLVRLSQPGRPTRPAHAVVAAVDPLRRELIWRHPDERLRGPWDAPLPEAIDPRRPLLLERVDLGLEVAVGGATRAAFGRLSLVAGHPRYAPALVAAGPEPLVVVTPLAPAPAPGALADAAAALVAELAERPLFGGGDGLAALSARDVTDAVAALEPIEEVALLVAPDAHLRPGALPAFAPAPPPPDPCCPCDVPEAVAPAPPPAPQERAPMFGEEDTATIQAALVAQCERRRDRFAILDAPAREGDPQAQLAVVRAWRKRFDTTFGALYHPWLETLDGEHRGAVRLVPPAGHLAGTYAATDLAVGVHHAPANVALASCHRLTMAVDETTHALLNDEGIDALRAQPGRGLRALGARTLSHEFSWRYVNVRRLLSMIETALLRDLQWAVFEPGDWVTRELLRLGATGLLETLWTAGALKGATAEEAFYVICDDTNNLPEAVANGQLVMDIGVAPALPAEFVVIRIGRTRDELTVLDPALALASGATA